MKLSIIVPIRNGEKYLRQCLDSILAQTFTDFELLLVNNASNDRSQNIIDEYVERDKRIITLHTDNLKVNAVRKAGLMQARGEYIGFVDCDDWIEPDMFATLVEYCDENKLEMVSSGMIQEFVDENRKMNYNDTIPEGVYNKKRLRQEVYPVMLSRPPFFTYGIQPNIWNKVFKRELLIRVFDNLDTNIIFGEDGTVIYKALLLSQVVGLIQKGYYHYRIHSKSNTYTVLPEFLPSSYLLYLQLKKTFEQDEQRDILLDQLNYFMINTAFFNLNRVFGININSMADWYMPFDRDVKNKRIAIYGAGIIGKNFFNKLRLNCDVEVTHWVDKQADSLPEDIESPRVLEKDHVDYVIIAVRNEDAACSIKKTLYRYKYTNKEILWQKYEKRFLFL